MDANDKNVDIVISYKYLPAPEGIVFFFESPIRMRVRHKISYFSHGEYAFIKIDETHYINLTSELCKELEKSSRLFIVVSGQNEYSAKLTTTIEIDRFVIGKIMALADLRKRNLDVGPDDTREYEADGTPEDAVVSSLET